MAIDVFTEERLEAAFQLSQIRDAKANWGRALVRTDINAQELDFLARSFKGCVERELKAIERVRSANGVLRALSRRG